MSGAANPVRGEAALCVGGERLVLRPSFEALVAAEEELGPLFALVERAAEGRLTVAEMAALFELLHDEMWLESRNDAALAAGANLAAVGNELLQFGLAEQVAPRRYRLSRLLRGRRGSEWAAGHAAGEPFVLLAPESLVAVDVPAAAVGGQARVLAAGLGDSHDGVEAETAVTGEALRPPSPVHLRAAWTAAGDLQLNWVRRSRGGWTWMSGADTPLGEEREAYRVTVAGPSSVSTAEVDGPAFTYSAAQQAADGALAPLLIEVVQLGNHAPSRPARRVVQ